MQQVGPSKVSELRKLFDGKSSGQTPVEFAQKQSKITRKQAIHNFQLRIAQQQTRRKSVALVASEQQDNIRDDPRRKPFFPFPTRTLTVSPPAPIVQNLSPDELTVLINKTKSPEDPIKALHEVLDLDVITTDRTIDTMSIKDLYILLPSLQHDPVYRVGEMRTKAHQHQSNKSTTTQAAFPYPAGDDNSAELANALSHGTELDINRAILRMFFQEFDPKRLNSIDKLLEEYRGSEDELFAEIAWNYPEHANRLVTFSIYASYEADDEGNTSSEDEDAAPRSHRRPSYIISSLSTN